MRHGERVAMLETIREYALERLGQEPDADALRRRHAEYFADLGKHAEPELKGTAAAAALERLAAEHDNLRASLDWLLEHEPEAAVRLVDALYLFWYVRGHYREGLRWYERALSVASGDPSARAAVVRRGAALAFACREFPLARSLIGEALGFYRAVGDAPNTVRALTLLGLIAINDGQPDEAVALLEESTALARGADDENVLSFALSNLGYVALTTRDLDRAYTASREAVELQRARSPERRNLSELGTALGNLGVAALAARSPRTRLAHVSPRASRSEPRSVTRSVWLPRARASQPWPSRTEHMRARHAFSESWTPCGSARMPSSSRSTPSCTSEPREQHSRSSGTKPSLVNTQAAGPFPLRRRPTSPCRRAPRHAAEAARGVRFQAAAASSMA